MKKDQKKMIGWREFISLPTLKANNIKVKIDTGARTSSLHVSKSRVVKRGRSKIVYFVIHPKQKSSRPEIKARAKVSEFRNVKSSGGHITERPVIITKIKIGKLIKEIELTLVNRDMMGFRMLLGREALRGDYIIDPSSSFILSKKRK